MKVTFYGQSCFGIETGGYNLLFDPFISPNPLASHVDVNSIPADFILLTHGHQDHMADLLSIAQRTGAQVITIFELVNWLASNGHENAYPMNTGGLASFDFGTVMAVTAVHSSSLPDGTYSGVPMGFVVQTPDKTFYHASDTALTYDMKLIPERFNLDFAILPIGSNFTMDIHDAAKAADFVQCNEVIGMHYDTFPYIEIDHQQAQDVFKQAGKNLHLLEIGKTQEF